MRLHIQSEHYFRTQHTISIRNVLYAISEKSPKSSMALEMHSELYTI